MTRVSVKSRTGRQRLRAGFAWSEQWKAADVTDEQLAELKADEHLDVRPARPEDVELPIASTLQEANTQIEKLRAQVVSLLQQLDEVTAAASSQSAPAPAVEPKPAPAPVPQPQQHAQHDNQRRGR